MCHPLDRDRAAAGMGGSDELTRIVERPAGQENLAALCQGHNAQAGQVHRHANEFLPADPGEPLSRQLRRGEFPPEASGWPSAMVQH